jgi:hypothetical protein
MRATATGLLAGVYHVAHAENRPTTEGAVQEADHFLSFAAAFIGPGRLRPVLDLEQNNTVLSPAALTDWIIAFSNEIIAQRGAGAAPIIYLGRSSANNAVDSRLANYDLWLAYPTNVDVSTSAPPPTASYPRPVGVFNNWSFWPYSWTGTLGGLNNLDLNVCHNEYKPLNSFLIPAPQQSESGSRRDLFLVHERPGHPFYHPEQHGYPVAAQQLGRFRRSVRGALGHIPVHRCQCSEQHARVLPGSLALRMFVPTTEWPCGPLSGSSHRGRPMQGFPALASKRID